MCRGSSPGTYSWCEANSTLKPMYGLRCRPCRKPSTTARARSSTLSRREKNSGSASSRVSIIASFSCPFTSSPRSHAPRGNAGFGTLCVPYGTTPARRGASHPAVPTQSVGTRKSHLLRHGGEEALDQHVGIDLVGAGVEVEHQPVPQHRRRQRLEVG